jgi:hypothetical protein
MLRLLGIVAVIGWLVPVGAAYTSLFLFPPPPDVRSLAPTPPDLSAAYLPLLASLLILGIIRRLRNDRRVGSEEGDR